MQALAFKEQKPLRALSYVLHGNEKLKKLVLRGTTIPSGEEIGSVAVVANLDDGVEQVFEHLIRILVARGHTHGLEHRTAFVVHPGLDALCEGHARLRLLILTG